MAEDIIKLLSRSGSPIILVFDRKQITQFQREPLQWGHKMPGDGKNLRFSTEIAAETVGDRLMGSVEH